MAVPSVSQYVRTETSYYSTIAEEDTPPAESQRRFGQRTFVNWTKNGAPVSADAASQAARFPLFILAYPPQYQANPLPGIPQGYFDCTKVVTTVFIVANAILSDSSGKSS